MPDAIDARLASLTLSGIDIGEFATARQEYTAVAPARVTQSTIDPHTEQSGVTVAISPSDADARRSGHQVAIADSVDVTVTVTSTDGSRKRVYRVSVASSAEASCLRGSIHVGVNLVSHEGGSVRDLASCAARLHVKALHVTQGGSWVSYIVGAPDIVNRAFLELYPDGAPVNTPLLATCDGPPAANTSPARDLESSKDPRSDKGSTQP